MAVKYRISDHYPIYACFDLKNINSVKANHTHKTITYRKHKHLNVVEFLRDLKNAPWHGIDFRSSSPDQSLETFLKIATTVIDKHLPLVTKRIRRQMQPEWMNLDILEAIRNRDGAKKHHNDSLYKVWRNKVTSLIIGKPRMVFTLRQLNYTKTTPKSFPKYFKNLWIKINAVWFPIP